jgi:hypothetical protein
VSVVQRTSRPSSPADRGELVGTIAGAVLVVPLLAAMGYGAWLLVRLMLWS